MAIIRDISGRFIKGNEGYWTGRKRKQKTKDKISETKKGTIPWNKDKTKEDFPQMGNSGVKKGNIPWSKGKTKEEFPQLSNNGGFKKGNIPWNKNMEGVYKSHRNNITYKEEYGIERAKVIREKMSLARIGKYAGENHPMFGVKHSKKSRKKMSRAHKAMMTKELIKKCLQRRIPSSLEEKFQGIIDKYNLPYRYVGNGSFIIENCNPDFINTNNEKIAVEVYARYYKLRNHISIKKWKKERAGVFAKYGWQIIYFDEIQVNENNVLEVLRRKS